MLKEFILRSYGNVSRGHITVNTDHIVAVYSEDNVTRLSLINGEEIEIEHSYNFVVDCMLEKK